ncbi:protein of unknown function [Magnetospirillum sp. XM-1]|nr:protein of unknown function [Magnetospirillum sp. XM-1]
MTRPYTRFTPFRAAIRSASDRERRSNCPWSQFCRRMTGQRGNRVHRPWRHIWMVNFVPSQTKAALTSVSWSSPCPIFTGWKPEGTSSRIISTGWRSSTRHSDARLHGDRRGRGSLRSRLLDLRPLLGVRTLSAVVRRLAEIAVKNPGGKSPWASVPALKEIALHLDRIASALQRGLLTSAPAGEHLKEVKMLLARLEDVLEEPRQ